MHAGLLETARKLLCVDPGQHATETDIRRAISSAYYALFHYLCDLAVQLIFNGSVKTLGRAKLQTYRALSHNGIGSACGDLGRKDQG